MRRSGPYRATNNIRAIDRSARRWSDRWLESRKVGDALNRREFRFAAAHFPLPVGASDRCPGALGDVLHDAAVVQGDRSGLTELTDSEGGEDAGTSIGCVIRRRYPSFRKR